jgi:DNA-binding CsgD family transcriptional regulator
MDEPGSSVDALEGVEFRRVVGRTTASSARSLLGRSCVVARVHAINGEGSIEIAVSGDRLVRSRLGAPLRQAALLTDSIVSEPIGRPAGYRITVVTGRVTGRAIVQIEAIAPATVIDQHGDELRGLATTAALALDHVSAAPEAVLEATGSDPFALANLTPREQQVLAMLTEGATSDRIGEHLGITRNTVRTHIQNIRTKLGVSTRLEAAAVAMRVAPPLSADRLGA